MVISRSSNPISNENPCIEQGIIVLAKEVLNVKSVPISLQDQNVYGLIAKHLELKTADTFEAKLNQIKKEVEKENGHTNILKIALVGKFKNPSTEKIFPEAYESEIQQLKISAADESCNVKIIFVLAQDLEDENPDNEHLLLLKGVHAILLPWGLGAEGFQGMLKVCKFARENKKPLLSICYSYQCSFTEFARNKCGNDNIDDKFKVLENGKYRTGLRTVKFVTKNSKLFELYGGKEFIKEVNFNCCELDALYASSFINYGYRIVAVGFDEDGNGNMSEASKNLLSIAKIHDADEELGYREAMQKLCDESRKTGTPVRMQAMELKDHPFYIGIQFYAKFGPNPSSPSPPFVGLLRAAQVEKERLAAL